MSISIFDPRIMAAAVESLPSTGGFFTDTFFPNKPGKRFPITGTKVDADFYKGGRQVAAFVNPKSASGAVEKKGYVTKTFETPLLKPKDVTTIEDITVRAMGESVYGGMTAEQRALTLLTRQLTKLDNMITRRVEWMASKAMLTGKIPVIGEGVNYEIDFGFTNSTALTGTKVWSNAASDPLSDLETWSLACQKNGNRKPNVCLMSNDAYSAFINNAKVKDKLDLKDMQIATINPQALSENVTYGGSIINLGLSIYIYNEWFIDDWTDPSTPAETAIVPAKTVMLASTNAETTLYYGEIVVTDSVTNAFSSVIGEKFADTWIEKDPDVRFLRMQSRPLPVPHEVDSWYVATVL